MKRLSKILLVLVLVVGVFTLVGCEKKESSKSDSKIVGTWVYQDSDDFAYTFNEDGTGKYVVGTTTMKFTYKTDGNKLSITYDGDTDSFDTTYSIKGKVLNVKDSNDEDTLYNKKD